MLSIVQVARNDGHGGDFLGRLGNSVRANAALAARHGLVLESVVVEWNPPAERPPMRHSVLWPASVTTRIITVPKNVHEALPGADQMPMVIYVAVNVGIRRAEGEHVLVTSADIILSDEMVHHLATVACEANCFYRAARSDLKSPACFDGSIDRLLVDCRDRVRITHNPVDAAGDFMLMSKADWIRLRGYPEFVSNGTVDTYMVELAKIRGMRQVHLPWAIYHQDHDRLDSEGRPNVWWHEELIGVANKDNGWGLGRIELPTEVVA